MTICNLSATLRVGAARMEDSLPSLRRISARDDRARAVLSREDVLAAAVYYFFFRVAYFPSEFS